ncbi:hypothetical protein [Oribacterium sp.]
MLTEAEREKVYFTRGFRNFCFRAEKANPHGLLLRLRKILYLCFMCLIVFAMVGFKITWLVKYLLFIGSLSIIANYFWGIWLTLIIYKHSVLFQLMETKKQQEKMQKYLSESREELLQAINVGNILVKDLGDGIVLYRNKKIYTLFYKGFFYDMELYEKLRKILLEPDIAIQQLNNNDNISKE